MARHPERRRAFKPPRAYKPWPSEGGFNHWDDITPPVFRDDEQTRSAPRLLAAKFKSSSREAEEFIHDPYATLAGEADGITSALTREDLPPDPHIATLVINHHRTLAFRVMRATAFVDDESIGITVHKEDGGS